MLKAGSGRIINVGANGALRGGALMGAYAATKASVIRLTESMSAELAKQGIGVNCVLPTIIDTPQNRAAMPDVDPSGWVAPAALADVVSFLASDGARALHRSEEHTSELQSLMRISYAVFCLKKKNRTIHLCV